MKRALPVTISALMVFCANIATAQTVTYRTDIHMVAEKSDTVLDEILTVGATEPILTAKAHAPRVVELLGDVTIGGLANETTFKAGDVLFGRYDETTWTYCAIAGLDTTSRVASAILLGALTAGTSLLLEGDRNKDVNCLFDGDNDGQFESAWAGGITQSETAFIAYTLVKTKMSGPVSYKRVPIDQGPIMPVEISWAKSKRTGLITFNTLTGGQKVKTETIAVPPVGSDPVEHKQFGAVFEIISYDAENDRLTYRLTKGSQRQYFRIPAIKQITTSYVYY